MKTNPKPAVLVMLLRRLPAKKGELPVIPVDDRAKEVRAIKAG
jgi:hypothetical protein